ncbi:MAG TPA: SRPBCC family protein [Candidatus Limnocylindria bacterium]|nr:SRPBCC family protein [Candidatus Limnocylindria bacterium]
MSERKTRRYHFISRWTVGAPADAVYAAIYEVVAYPAWWPEVKEARKLDEDHLWMRTRSFLPYDLSFALERTVTIRMPASSRRASPVTSRASSAGRSSLRPTAASSRSTRTSARPRRRSTGSRRSCGPRTSRTTS